MEKGAAIESGNSRGSAKGDETGGFTELFRLNQVLYRMAPTLSIVAKRTLLQNYFTKTNYTNFNQTLYCTFSTGEYYVAPKTSYLYVEYGYVDPLFNGTSNPPVNAYLDTMANIAQGDWMSQVYEPLFTSSSGTEVCRETEKALYSCVEARYKYDQQYIDTYGQAQGISKGRYSSIWDGAGASGDFKNAFFGACGTSIRPHSGATARSMYGEGLHNVVTSEGNMAGVKSFIIPMNKILGIFAPYCDCLLPAGLLAGSRFEMRLKNPIESLMFQGLMNNNYSLHGVAPYNTGPNFNLSQLVASAANIQITNIYFVLDAFQLQDAVLKRLNEVAAGQDGLALMFDTFDFTPYTSTAGQFEAQVSQARSRVIRSFCVIRDQANTNNPYINSQASEPAAYRVDSYGWSGMNLNFGAISVGGDEIGNVLYSNAPWYNFLAGNPNVPAGDVVYYPQDTSHLSNATPTPVGYSRLGTFRTSHDTLRNLTTNGGISTPTSVVTYQAAQPQTQNTFVQNVTTWAETVVCPHPGDVFTTAPATRGSPVVISYQAQLGALFFPQQPFKTVIEHYFNALYLFGKSMAQKDVSCSVSLEDFVGGYGWNLYNTQAGPNYPLANFSTKATPLVNVDPTWWTANNNAPAPPALPTSGSNFPYIYNWGCAVYGALFEKNQLLEMSGLPVSNARLLRHKFQFGDSGSLSGQGRFISVYTTYTRVCKVFLGGLVVVRE